MFDYYNKFVIPYCKNNVTLEPITRWQKIFEQEQGEEIIELHLILALRWSEKTASELQVTGGITLEYYPMSNCALLRHFLLPPKLTQKTNENDTKNSLDKTMLSRAISIANKSAQDSGCLSGVSALFLETSSDPKYGFHEWFNQLGFMQVDIDFTSPPIIPEQNSRTNLLLGVFLSPNIPHMPDDDQDYYLPNRLLADFIDDMWRTSYKINNIIFSEENEDFKLLLDRIDVREKVPLLALTNQSEIWKLVDLRDDYDEELLIEFYNNLILANFPLEVEREPLENWIKGVQTKNSMSSTFSELHIVLALSWSLNGNKLSKPVCGGGIVFDYYPVTNAGLLAYLVVDKVCRGQGMAGKLVARAVECLESIAKRRGQLAGCNVIFLETNSTSKVTPQQDVMDPRVRQIVYYKMGFRMLDFKYVMAPLGAGMEKCDFLLLTVYITSRIPTFPAAPLSKMWRQPKHYLPSQLLLNFIWQEWKSAFQKANIPGNPDNDPDFLLMVEQLQLRDKIPLLGLPWGGGKPWQLVDLYDDYDEDLLVDFHQKFIVPYARAIEEELEPIENWKQALKADDYRDLHVILALNFEETDHVESLINLSNSSDEIKKNLPTEVIMNIVGGLVYEYYEKTNCAMISYMLVDQNQPQKKLLELDLLQQALVFLEQNAIAKGNIAGANAIFSEVDLTPVLKNDKFSETLAFEEIARGEIINPTQIDEEEVNKLEFGKVDLNYFSPPVSESCPKARNSLLIILLTDRVLSQFDDENLSKENPNIICYLPTSLIRSFISTLWETECKLINYNYKQNPNYLDMIKELETKEEVNIIKIQ
eukprot:TRINITY_DN1465_c0_g1_i6.p1 TRINITY_DN1465_c0_g1~~TRINITY_DN1465_c0_g1_i6.p1  ORF type:complete len:817 (+),score=178.59 TRINITY_DN1465_c0_g1_i6:161-2611(+)